MTHLPVIVIFLCAVLSVALGWFFLDVVGPQSLTQWWAK